MFKNCCHCNAAISDLYHGKSKSKIAVAFFFLIPMTGWIITERRKHELRPELASTTITPKVKMVL